MSETPETDANAFDAEANSIIYKVVFAAFASQLERERNNLQDQRDFCMGEIERLKKEATRKDGLIAEMREVIRWVRMGGEDQTRLAKDVINTESHL